MEIELTPEQDAVVRHAIASGRITRPEDAVSEALAAWTERERQRVDLIASLDEAEAEYRRGESTRIDSEAQRRTLVDDIARRIQARIAGRSNAHS